MLKIIVACLGVFLGLVSPTSATEVQPKSLVVVDTGFDTQLPIFQERVITEVCILDWSRCPNRSNFQEGVGSAFLPRAISQFNGFFHGTQMASIARAQDSTIKVILIRIIADSQSGFRLPVQDSNISQVLEWVINNRDKFNIGAVAMAIIDRMRSNQPAALLTVDASTPA